MIPQKKLGRTNLNISRIGLGTAEIGMAYGIGKRNLPNDKEAKILLKTAVELGINFFDTANYYGLAEQRIGDSGISKIPGIIIATKCAQFLEKEESCSKSELEKRIREQAQTSLKNLKLDVLPLLQLHSGGNKSAIENGEAIEIFQKLKKEGLIKYTGISTRGEETTIAAIKSDFFDAIQVAYSILDQRMSERAFPIAQKKNIGIINRSVFLKGALTPASEKLPTELIPLKINANKAAKIAEELNIDLPALALRFTLNEPAITTSLIGTNKIINLKKTIEAISNGPLPPDVVRELKKLVISDPSQIDPVKWPPIS
jgi:aryl-alcohol dehydrogenase-like predicted oxidoreductase